MSRWPDLRPMALAAHEYRILTRTPLGYPAAAMHHGDPAALDRQESPLHVLQQITDG